MDDAPRTESQPLNGPCPNCRSDDIIRVGGGPDDIGAQSNGVHFGRVGRLYLTRLVCLTCGLVRECVDDWGSLTLLRREFGRREYGAEPVAEDTGLAE
jgi:hypothetical protein